MKSIRTVIITLIIASMLLSCIGVSAASADADAVYKLLSYEVITDEVHYALTKDLDLKGVGGRLNTSVPITWSSSDTSVITNNGAINREHYKNGEATLTATIGTGSGARRKEFDFTVLSSVTEVYSADTFYYPEYEGKLVSDAASATGWGFTKATELGDTGMNTIITKEDADTTNYYTKGYRTGSENINVHYTRQSFGGRKLGQLTWEADLMLDNTQVPQIYIFEFWGDYKVGQYIDPVQLSDFRVNIDGNGNLYTFVTYYDGETTKSRVGANPYGVIKEKTWARVRFDFDTYNQTINVSIDGVPYITDIPFYEKNRSNITREDFLGLTHIQYGPFRTYTSGNGVCFDNVSFRDNNQIYSDNAEAYEFSDKMTLSLLTDENADSITTDLDLSLSSLKSEMNSKDINVSWTSSNEAAISISENKASVVRGQEPQAVTLTANISQAGKTHIVKKEFNLTVMPDESYVKVYNVYKKLTAEAFTEEPVNAVSKNLDFSDANIEKYASLDGVNISFASSNENVIASDGTVTRTKGDKKCTITAKVADNANNVSMTKSFDYTVLDEDRYVYYATNFNYPTLEGADISALEHLNYWGGPADTGDSYESTLVKEGDNYILQSVRGEANKDDMRFNYILFPEKARGNVKVSMKLKFEHDKNPGMYVFYVDGVNKNGSSIRCGEIRFDYDASTTHITFETGIVNDKTTYGNENTSKLPPVGEWFLLELDFDVLSQSYDVYVNGDKYNTHAVPFYYSLGSNAANAECRGITNIKYNTYRYTTNNVMYTDDISVTGERYLQANMAIFENGKKIRGIKYVSGFEGNTYTMTGKIVNDTNKEQKFNLYVAVYDDGKMVSINKKSTLELAVGEYKSEEIGTVNIPGDVTNVSMKVFFIDDKLSPAEVNSYIPADIIDDYTCETYYFPDTGRSMQYVDLHGKIAYKPYFNAQCWSADSLKLYFQGKDHSIYEYDTINETIRFISEGYSDYGIVTTPQNKLIFSNADKQIVEMDCETYEKRLAGELPEGQTGGASQLTVSNDGKKLGVMWSDTTGNLPNDGKKYRCFAVLDMETGVWDTQSFFGFEDTPPYNLGMNPAYSNLILFNHCAPADQPQAPDRNWVMDTNTGIATQVFNQIPYSDTMTGEIYSHETWSYDGELLYIDKANSSLIGRSGVMSFDKDGKNRRHITDDSYSYLHLGVSPVNPRFIVSDTGYGTSKTSDIILVDCHSGKSYNLATTNQRGDDSVAHSHPAFSPDGQKVYFGVFNGDYTSAGIGIIDVSDIVNQPDYLEIVTLSDNCTAESYKDMKHEVTAVTKDGSTGYNIKNGNFMRVNYITEEKSNAKADIEITYFADGGKGELGYYTWTVDPATHNSLDEHTYTFTKLNTGKWETVTISLDDINLWNMDLMGSDFYIKGVDSELVIKNVNVICDYN